MVFVSCHLAHIFAFDLLSDHEITCPSLPSQRGSFTCIEVLGFRQLAHQALEGGRYMRSAYLM